LISLTIKPLIPTQTLDHECPNFAVANAILKACLKLLLRQISCSSFYLQSFGKGLNKHNFIAIKACTVLHVVRFNIFITFEITAPKSVLQP
ncbi:hypothetical protein OAC51_09985, partial [Flavobacteriaceae bacterium]|nr:hypothetical protein [Flavobacteriaceae bacterium]